MLVQTLCANVLPRRHAARFAYGSHVPRRDRRLRGYAPLLGTVLLAAVGAPGVTGAVAVTTSAPALHWGWGQNRDGELGLGQVFDSAAAPQKAANAPAFVTVSAGYNHMLGITADGAVYGWGTNYQGAIAGKADSAAPVAIKGVPDKVVAVSAGDNFSLAVTLGGKVYAWGQNAVGQTSGPINAAGLSSVPVLVSGLGNVTAIAAGGSDNLALKSDGTVWAWGDNANGELGAVTAPCGTYPTACSTRPAQIVELSGIQQIAAGWDHELALGGDGTIWAWGNNERNQLGVGSVASPCNPGSAPAGMPTKPCTVTPVKVTGAIGAPAIQGIAAGTYYSAAIGASAAPAGLPAALTATALRVQATLTPARSGSLLKFMGSTAPRALLLLVTPVTRTIIVDTVTGTGATATHTKKTKVQQLFWALRLLRSDASGAFSGAVALPYLGREAATVTVSASSHLGGGYVSGSTSLPLEGA